MNKADLVIEATRYSVKLDGRAIGVCTPTGKDAWVFYCTLDGSLTKGYDASNAIARKLVRLQESKSAASAADK